MSSNSRLLLCKAVRGGQPGLRRAPRGGLGAYRGGWFIPAYLWNAERRRAADAMPGLLRDFGERLQFLREVYQQQVDIEKNKLSNIKIISLSSIESQMKQAIRETYATAFRLGKRAAGNLTGVSEDEQKWLRRIRVDEYKYLRGFLGDMRSEDGVMDYEARMDMYRAAAREAYALGWVLGNKDKARRIRWVLGNTEHCSDCARIAEMGSMPVSVFIRDVLSKGYVPHSGNLECKGYHCQCSLEEAFV